MGVGIEVVGTRTNPRERVTVLLTINGVDYTNSAIFSLCNFTLSASAAPGTCTVVLKDRDKKLSFVPGINSIIKLYLNGVLSWAGYAMQIEQGYMFDSVKERKWTLYGVDYNILLDKYFMYNKEYPNRSMDGGGTYPRNKKTNIVEIPRNTSDRSYITTMLSKCSDIQSATPAIDVTGTQIEEIGSINPDASSQPPIAGLTVRAFMEDVSRSVLRTQPGSSIWYIGPDAKLYYKATDSAIAPYWVGEGDTTVAYNGVYGLNPKNLSIMTDISSIKNDVLIFTGNLNPSPTSTQEHLLYRKNSLTASVNQYGRFQYSEVMGSDWIQTMINARSTKILYQEATPSMRVSFTTYHSGFFPGQLLYIKSDVHTFNTWDANLTTMQQTNAFRIPIRTISMSFPVKDVCQYDINCSVDTQDPWGLLLALKRPLSRGLSQPRFEVIDLVKNPNQIPSANTYDFVREKAKQATGTNMFSTTYAYIRGSLVVYYDGLRISPLTNVNKGFIESDPEKGLFKLGFTPTGGQTPEVEYHVWTNIS